jgi:hypothetical protein
MTDPTDKDIPNVGGAVLDPTLALDTGVRAFQDLETVYGLHKCVADIDGTSLYPSIGRAANVDRDTKTATIMKIENVQPEEIEDFCTNVAAVRENAMYIGHKYFGLPNHQELLQLWDAQHAR